MAVAAVEWAAAKRAAELILAQTARYALRAGFDPDEPRDESGQWTEGGGDGGGESIAGPATVAPSEPLTPLTESEAVSVDDKGKAKVTVDDFETQTVKGEISIDRETIRNKDKGKQFVDHWNEKIDLPPEEFHEQFLGGMNGSMNINYRNYSNTDEMEISGDLRSDNGQRIGNYTRVIDFKNNKAESNYFKVFGTGRNVGKRMLAANVATYQKMGLDKVEVHANIDVGGYAWAKYGYVPTRGSWRTLRAVIDEKIDAMSTGSASMGEASSWDELSSGQQDRIESAFYRDSFDEFLSSEVESWRDSGQPLQEAKTDLVEKYNEGSNAGWAEAAIETYTAKREKEGKSAIPFSNDDLLDAIEVDFHSRYDDGRGDLDVTFNDDKLQKPQGYDPTQQTLPGIEPIEPHERLTEEMRDGLTKAYQRAFDREADRVAGDMDPPSYLSDSVRESQSEYWGQMDDGDRYRWASRNGELPEVEQEGTGEIDEGEADALRHLINSDDPKALWRIADSKWGKDLLLNSDWNGVLDLHDKQTMDRFNAYVGKAKAEAAAA